MQLCTTTRNVGPVSPFKVEKGNAHDALAGILANLIISARLHTGMTTKWTLGEIRRHVFKTLAITIIIVLPTPLLSQSAGIHYNLPLILAGGEQLAPVLVNDGDEGAFVIWHDKRDGRSAIYAQHLNRSSQPTWQQNGILVASGSKDQLAVTAIADANKGVLIFWQDLRNDAGDIYGQRLDANGNLLWTATGVQVNGATNKQAEPQAVSDGAGGAFVLWRDFKSGNEDVSVQRVNSEGKILFESAGKSIAAGLGNQTLGDAAATTGGCIAIWNDNSTGLSRVAAQRFNAGADPQWKTNLWLAPLLSTQLAPITDIACHVDSRDNAVVVWSDNRNRRYDLFAQKIDALGTLQWGFAGVTVCQAASDQTNPQIIGDSSDGVLIAWEDERSGRMDIYAQAVSATGQTRWQSDGVAIVAASQNQTQPQIISDSNDGLICVWTDDRNAGTSIVAQRLDKDGRALWDENGIFITPEGGAKEKPAILALPGEFLGRSGSFIAWEDSRRGNEDIFTQALKGDGTLANAPPVILSSPVVEANAGSLYNYPVKALDYDSADPLHLELVAPANSEWLQVDDDKLQLFGTPSLSDTGEIAVTLAVTDKFGAQVTQSFTLKVISNNRPPQITSRPDTLATEDQLYSYQIVATDPDPDEVITFALQTGASWLTLSDNNELTGLPTNEQVGNYSVTLTATDKLGVTATQQFSLRVENVNDRPVFTSRPDTIAFVDSMYVYRPTAADVDRDDSLQIIKREAPEWLSWNTITRTLQGKPGTQHAGTIYPVNFFVRDAAGASGEQAFQLRVVAIGPLDVTAPASAQAVQVEPAQWSANKRFTLRWQNPFDPSGVAGAFYKIGAPPVEHQDGVFVPIPNDGTIAQLEFLATNEGKTPVYLWLMDGRGNTDFHTAIAINYRYDTTPPAAPQNLSPNRQWSRGDSLLLQWTPATDATSGIQRYHFFLDGAFFGFISGEVSNFRLILQLGESTHVWTFVAEDSAGNLSDGTGATFKVDRTPPALQHQAVDTTSASTALTLSAQSADALSLIHELRFYYRAAGESSYRIKNFQNVAGADFSTRLETAEVPSKGLEYFLEAADSAGNRSHWPSGAPANFQAVVVRSASVGSPAPFVTNRYQIVSIPYRLQNDSPLGHLADDLGNYDPTVWRLFRYRAGQGNVELGTPEFENLAPGRAFWLITTAPRHFDVDSVHSIRSGLPFDLTLQPGWNLIATPFDFPTSWLAAQKPSVVENNLWAFDGTKYVDNQTSLWPWQGYFVRNLETQPQTISIQPVAGSSVNKPSSRLEGVDWQVQLRASDGEFSDDTNYLGVAPRALEAWDALDFSEPPSIGEHVSMYFDRRDWPRYAGLFTSDFRPATETVQKWSFSIVASRPGLPVELSWNFSGNIPEDWIFVLQDVDGHMCRQIRAEEFNTPVNYHFRATSQARNFIWWAGKEERLAEAGALQELIPVVFELAPIYPNPLRLSGASEIGVIRFGLPEASSVRITIFDLVGRQVRTLLAPQNLTPGYHEVHWNGCDDRGHIAAAGIYLYRLETAKFSASRKLVLLR